MTVDEKLAFIRDRQGAIVGRKLADQYGWKIGDTIPIRGTIFPGTWNFTLRGIWDGAEAKTDEAQMLFHWQYLNESVKQRFPKRADAVGVLIVGIDAPAQAAEISQRVDLLFKNSLAETLTETESAFQLSFVSMSEQILIAIEAVSYIIVLIILAVTANTMTMTARERLAEYRHAQGAGFWAWLCEPIAAGRKPAHRLHWRCPGDCSELSDCSSLWQGGGQHPAVLLYLGHHGAGTGRSRAGCGADCCRLASWQIGRINIVNGLRNVA